MDKSTKDSQSLNDELKSDDLLMMYKQDGGRPSLNTSAGCSTIAHQMLNEQKGNGTSGEGGVNVNVPVLLHAHSLLIY